MSELTPDEQAWCTWAQGRAKKLAIPIPCETESTRAFCEGARQARAKVRRELVEATKSWFGQEYLLAALDRIVPEEG